MADRGPDTEARQPRCHDNVHCLAWGNESPNLGGGRHVCDCGAIEIDRAVNFAGRIATLSAAGVSDSERDALREQLDAARQALEAYATEYPCPGIVVDDGVVSGCKDPSGRRDCPTCRAALGVVGPPPGLGVSEPTTGSRRPPTGERDA